MFIPFVFKFGWDFFSFRGSSLIKILEINFIFQHKLIFRKHSRILLLLLFSIWAKNCMRQLSHKVFEQPLSIRQGVSRLTQEDLPCHMLGIHVTALFSGVKMKMCGCKASMGHLTAEIMLLSSPSGRIDLGHYRAWWIWLGVPESYSCYCIDQRP